MGAQKKPDAVSNANKTIKSKGKKGQKRIGKTQPSGSRSGARRPPSKANDNKASFTVTLPTPGGLCSFCRYRQHTNDNDNNVSGNNQPLLVEVKKVEVFKKFMKELGYLGSGDKGFGDDEEVKYCYPCGKAMESVLGLYKEIMKALSAVLNNHNATGGGKDNNGREESEMSAIVVKEEFDDIDVGEGVGNVGEDVGEMGFLTPRSSLAMEMEATVPAGDPLDEALGKSEELEDESERTPIVVKEEDFDEGTSSYQEGVGEEGFSSPQTSLTTESEAEAPLAEDPVDEASGESESEISALEWEDGWDDPKYFLKFFGNGKRRKTDFISLKFTCSNEKGYDGLTLVGAVHKILQNNWAPSLRVLCISDFDLTMDGSRDLYEDCDFSKSLENLEVMIIESYRYWEEDDALGRGSPSFLNAILRGAANLKELYIEGHFFPEQSAIRNWRNLKCFHFDSQLKRKSLGPLRPSLIPEFERVLFQVSTNCPLLEELRIDLPSRGRIEPFNFPIFPRLEKFVWSLNGLSFIESDFILFLDEKMPNLRSCTVSGSYITKRLVENLLTGFQSSEGKHKELVFLSIPAPEDFRLLEGFKANFPSLTDIRVNAERLKRPPGKAVERIQTAMENRLGELAVVLANAFPSIPVTLVGLGIADCEEVKKQFLEKVGPQFKGTFSIINSGLFHIGCKEIRLFSEKETSKV